MGAIARLSSLSSGGGREAWGRVFGGAAGPLSAGRGRGRPYGSQKPGGSPAAGGGGFGNSAASSSGNAFMRLLQAMRSNAPGGWSDDRYEQTLRHYTGITYVAIHRLCTQLARAEFQVFREDDSHPDGKRPVGKGEEAYELVELLKRPNRQDTFGRLMYRWGLQKRLTGSALTWVVPNILGKPFEMYSVPTALAIPQAATNPEYPEGFYRIQPIYPYGPFSSFPAPASSVGAPISADWMMRFQYPHPLLRYEGYAPLTAMRLHIDSIEMIDRARHYLMRRGIHPSAVLNSVDSESNGDINEDEIERIRLQFETDHMSPENWGRLFVAYAGWKLEEWGNPPSEMAFEAGWDQLSDFILGGAFGITKPAAGMIEDSSYSTLFATLKQLHLITLEPECEEIGAELTHFLGRFWGDDIIIDVRTPRIDDHEIKNGKLQLAMQGKCLTKNQLLKALDMPTTSEPWGDEIAGEMPQQMGGQMGMTPGAVPGGDMEGAPAQGAPTQQPMPMEQPQQEEDPLAAIFGTSDEEKNRPTPGDLGRGALGPRMGTVPKSLKRKLHTANGRR